MKTTMAGAHGVLLRKYFHLVFVLLFVATAYLLLPTMQTRLGAEKDELIEKSAVFYLPSRVFLRIFSLGFDPLIADFFWIKAVTYSEADALEKVFMMSDGEMHEYLHEQPFDRRARQRVFQMLDITTDFDPQFLYAYEFGGNVLAWSNDVGLANLLLEKGLKYNRNNPEAWKLAQTLGFNTFFFRKDPVQAAKYMEEADRLAKGKFRTKDLAAAFLLAGKKYDLAISMLESLLNSAPDEDTRQYYEAKIKYFLVEKDLDMLNGALHLFIQHYEVAPLFVDAFVKTGILDEIPKEPFGGVYVINRETLRVENKPYRRNRFIMSMEQGVDLQEELKRLAPAIEEEAERGAAKEHSHAGHKETGHEHSHEHEAEAGQGHEGEAEHNHSEESQDEHSGH